METNNMMDLIRQQQPAVDPAVAAGSESMSDSSTPPMGSPMSTPEIKSGDREGAMVNLSMAQDLLEKALISLGSDSEEGKSVLGAIGTINRALGSKKQKAGELQQSEILQMLQNLPQAGGQSPEGSAMAQAPQIPGLPQQGAPSAPNAPVTPQL